jgi:hypothetical protein
VIKARLTSAQRYLLEDWLDGPDGRPITPTLHLPTLPTVAAAHADADPRGDHLAFDEMSFDAVMLRYPRAWMQWVAVDRYDGEPVAFGRIHR